MYQVTRTIIKPTHELHEYCSKMTALSKNLYNAALFRVRNIFTGYDKETRTANENEVFEEIRMTEAVYHFKMKRKTSYTHLEKLMRVTKNIDFFAGLSMQSSQAMVKKVGNPQVPRLSETTSNTCIGCW